MQMKRLMAGTLAAMTAGATLAMGAFGIANLGDYVTTSDGSLASPIIVVGDGSGSSGAGIVKDVLGAADIAAAVAGYATTTTTGGASGASVTVTGGAQLDTPNQKLYLYDTIDNATQTLTSNELPTLLASGTVSTNDGDYDYDQFIELGNVTIEFSKSSEDIDPVPMILVGTTKSDGAYKTKVVFSKALNFSDTDTPGEALTLFGTEYTISSESTNSKVVLFGAGQSVTLSEGDETVVSIGGTSYTIKLLGVSSPTAGDTAIVQVNDVSDEVIEEASRKIGGLNIYAKDVFYLGKESQVSSATLQLGSQKLILEDTKEVKITIGSDDTTIDNTHVSIAGTNDISSITVATAAQDSDTDHVAVDTPFVDPVYGGFQLEFGGMVPAADSTSIETIDFNVGGDDDATVQFADDRGNSKTLSFAHNTDGNLVLKDSGSDQIYNFEGAVAREKDYIMVDSGDFGHLFEVTEIDPSSLTDTGEVSLKDVFSGATITKVIPKAYTNATWVIDGQTYYVNITDKTVDEVIITWGTGSNIADIGSVLTVFPTIETAKGALIALVDDILVSNVSGLAVGDSLELPGGETVALTENKSAALTGLSPGKVQANFMVDWINETVGQKLNITVEIPDSQGNLTTPGVLIIEEEDNDDQKHAILVYTEYDSANTEIQWTRPRFTNAAASGSDTLESDNKVRSGRDEYGSTYAYDTDPDQNAVTVTYPDYQSFAIIAIGTDPVFSVGELALQTAVKLTAPVSKIASEVNADAPGADLILVGGPCANSVTAAVMGVATTYPECAVPFEGLTKGIVAEYTDAFTDASKALVVAGVTADDTRSLAAGVMAGTFAVNE